MIETMRITPERPKPIAVQEECDVLRKALSDAPGAAKLRLRLAELLIEIDSFDETVELLSNRTSDEIGGEGLIRLGTAYLARSAPGDVELAMSALTKAIEIARNEQDLARILLLQAKAKLREKQDAEAQRLLEQAIALDPCNAGVLERLASLFFRQGHYENALSLTDSLMAEGIGHAQLLAIRTEALAGLGRFEEAQALSNMDGHGLNHIIQPPDGWDDLASFNASLVEELTANPAHRFGRFGTASVQSWRIDRPAVEGAPAMTALLNSIAATAIDHVRSLGDHGHPWLEARPRDAILRSWCVMTDGEGYERWHLHPAGWMSGGYYPQVPQLGASQSNRAGCFVVGLPGRFVGEEAASRFGETYVAPSEGTLTLFPSHCFHRTYPHQIMGARRICIAFDIIPIGP